MRYLILLALIPILHSAEMTYQEAKLKRDEARAKHEEIKKARKEAWKEVEKFDALTSKLLKQSLSEEYENLPNPLPLQPAKFDTLSEKEQKHYMYHALRLNDYLSRKSDKQKYFVKYFDVCDTKILPIWNKLFGTEFPE